MDINSCRICLTNAGEMPLNIKHEIDNKIETVSEMILNCFNFEISNSETAPQSVCQECYENVVNAWNFKKVMQESDHKIQEMLNEVEMKVEFLIEEEEDNSEKSTDQLEDYEYHSVEEFSKSDLEDESLTPSRIKKELLEVQKCYICDIDFDSKQLKLRHFKTEHSTDERPQCEYCKHVAKNYVTLNIHLKNHNCTFTCSRCSRKFATQQFLDLHMQPNDCTPKKFSTSLQKFFCPNGNCNRVFSKEEDLEKHLKYKNEFDECRKTKDPTIKCYICDELFRFSYQKKNHLEEVHGNEKNLSCKMCDASPKTARSLDRHLRGHFENLSDVICEICGRKFEYHELLKKHIQLHHTQRSFYTCDLCGVNLSLKQSVQRHMKSVHMKQFNYHCEICGPGYSYTNLTSYNSHLYKNHGKVPPISCPDCGSGFTFNYELKNHKGKDGLCSRTKEYVRVLDENNKIRWRAQKTWEFGYFSDKKGEIFCKVCDKRYTTTDNLMIHYKVQHQGYRFQCDQCDNHYSSRKGLRTHKIARHLNLRPYSCQVCGKDFNEKRNLDRHMLTHTGRRDFNCPICEKAFQEKGGVRRHLKTVHKHLIQIESDGTIKIKTANDDFQLCEF